MPTLIAPAQTVEAGTNRLRVGDRVPMILTKQELADATGYSLNQIDKFRRSHNHPGIKELDAPGHPRFCGKTLQAWLDGRPKSTNSKKSRRYFSSHSERIAR